MDIDDIILNSWAGGAAPKPAPLETAPKPTDDLTGFAVDDAVIVNCGLVRVSAQRTTASVIASCAVVHSH